MVTSSDAACETVQRLADSYVSPELTATREQMIRRHIDTCHVCYEMFEERVLVKTLIQRAVRSQTVDEGLMERIRKSIREG
jgi:hypothetical protein